MRRRTLLKTAGASIGTVLAGTNSAVADGTERFVVDRTDVRPGDVPTVVHDLEPVDLLVVETTEERLADADADYARDRVTAADDFAPERGSGDVDRDVERDADGGAVREPHPAQWDKRDQRVPEAHEITRGDGARIAVIDSGVASGHPDLEGRVNLDLSRSFTRDDYGVGEPYGGFHGTHVAGIAAADGHVVGTAPEAEVVDLRVFGRLFDADAHLEAGSDGEDGSDLPPDVWTGAWTSDVLAALVYATEIGCDAANLSLGWTWLMRRDGWGEFWGKAMQRVGTYALTNGTVHVHACGNWGGSLQYNQDETDSSEVAGGLTVSATGPVGFDPETGTWDEPPHAPASYTNHGVGAVDVGAPGGHGSFFGGNVHDDVYNAVAAPIFDRGEYVGAHYDHEWLAGTSMAAPQVAGAAALVASAAPDLQARQVRSTLTRAADHPDEYERKFYGSGGYLDTCAAVADAARR